MARHAVVVLGGNSSKNLSWVRRVSRSLEKDFDVYSLKYLHWNDEADGEIDFDKELRRLKDIVSTLESYSIVAKSAGFVLALMAVAKGVITPQSITGFGIPLEYARVRGINLSDVTDRVGDRCSVLCVQAARDPQGFANDVRSILPLSALFRVVPGESHDYDKYEKVSSFARTFIRMHLPLNKDTICSIKVGSLSDAVRRVFYNKEKYRLRNNWLYNPIGNITIFSYGTAQYVAKFVPSYSKAFEEIEKARAFAKETKGVKFGLRSVEVVVPQLVVVEDNIFAVISPYIGEDCNEYFYRTNTSPVTSPDVYKYMSELLVRGVQYPGLLPRNTIVKGDKVYLIDFEAVRLHGEPTPEDRTTILIGWSILPGFVDEYATKLYAQCIFSTPHQPGVYGDALITSVQQAITLSGEVGELINSIALEAEQNTRTNLQSALIKRDDVVNIISECTTPVEEARLDAALYCEKSKNGIDIYQRASSLAKMIRFNSELPKRYQINIQSFVPKELGHILKAKN